MSNANPILTAASVSQLYIYPIKSCGPVELSSMAFDSLGALHDRRYMLVDEHSEFVSQRLHPQLCLVQCIRQENSWQIMLPNGDSHRLPFEGITSEFKEVNVWGDKVVAYDQGKLWADFFSAFLSMSVRLVYVDEERARYVDRAYTIDDHRVGFADGFPILVANQSSLDEVNLQTGLDLEMLRFRPNIVLKGLPAWKENHSKTVEAKELTFHLLKPCSRCVIPSINPHNGEKQKAVLSQMQPLLKWQDGKMYFGQNAILEGSGELLVGDSVFMR